MRVVISDEVEGETILVLLDDGGQVGSFVVVADAEPERGALEETLNAVIHEALHKARHGEYV